jgi:hypothetical protein
MLRALETRSRRCIFRLELDVKRKRGFSISHADHDGRKHGLENPDLLEPVREANVRIHPTSICLLAGLSLASTERTFAQAASSSPAPALAEVFTIPQDTDEDYMCEGAPHVLSATAFVGDHSIEVILLDSNRHDIHAGQGPVSAGGIRLAKPYHEIVTVTLICGH